MNKEQYVSFEIAQILKEKGFDWKCEHKYNLQKDIVLSIDDSLLTYYCPTQQMACAWLREEKGIHIMVSTGMNACSKPMRFYHANLAQMEEDKTIYGDPIDVDFDTYEDAVEAALKYVLTNLI